MSSTHNDDPLLRITRQVADCFSNNGYAFVEDDRLDALAAVLAGFLLSSEIPVNTSAESGPGVPA